MTRLSKDVLEGAVGYDSTSDPADLDPKYCQKIINLLPDRNGLLRGNISLSPLSQTFAARVDGCGWFYSSDAYYTNSSTLFAATVPKLLAVANGVLNFFSLVNLNGEATTYPPTFTGPIATGGVFTKGQRVRFLGFGKEVYATQQANQYSNYRITTGNSVYPMGIATPTLISGTGGVVLNSPPNTLTTAINGTPVAGGTPLTVTGATNATPIVITTSTDHGFEPGQRVYVASVGGNTNANGFAYVGAVTHNTFQLMTNGIAPEWVFNVQGGTITTVQGIPVNWQLYCAGAFTNYVFNPGDTIYLSGTDVTTGTYTIVAKISNDTIALAAGNNPLTSSNTVGTNVSGVPTGNAKTGNSNYTSGGTVVPYNKTGVVQYAMTFVDALGRESDLSTPVSVDYTVNTDDAIITATGLAVAGANGSVVSANIYGTQGNGTVFYLIGNLPWAISDPNLEDNLTDLEIQAGTVSAFFGENAPPLPAQIIATDNGRIFLDATDYQGVLQISNQNSATQYAVTPQLLTDGETIALTSDQGNPLTGFATFGSMFAVFLRRGLYVLQGTDYTTYYITRIHDRGCIAPDSVLRADNHVIWLSDNGVYIGSYIYRFQLEYMSKQIEADIYAYNSTVAGRQLLENACAAFVNDMYWLAIGNTVFVFNFDTQGWFQLQLSGSATVTSMNVVQQQGTPGLIYVGLSNNTIGILDLYTLNQTVTGMVYRTRLVQPDPSADEASKGQTVDTLLARTKRVVVKGTGAIGAGSTITMTCDGRTETYPVPASGTPGYPPIPWNEVQTLVFQEFTPLSFGYRRDVTLNLSGTGILIQSVRVENEGIG